LLKKRRTHGHVSRIEDKSTSYQRIWQLTALQKKISNYILKLHLLVHFSYIF